MVVLVDGFSSLQELYNRVKPALKSKCKDLKRIGVDFVVEADIWNYLKNNIWVHKHNLSLGEIVNDIMCVDNVEIIRYVESLKREVKAEF